MKRNFSSWKTASIHRNQPELIWQEIFECIEGGQYEQVEALFLRLQEESPEPERLDLKLIFTAVLQISRACMQMKAEEERYRNAHQDVLKREHELQQELREIAGQLRQWQLTPDSLEACRQQAATLSPPRADLDSPAPGWLARVLRRLKPAASRQPVSTLLKPEPDASLTATTTESVSGSDAPPIEPALSPPIPNLDSQAPSSPNPPVEPTLRLPLPDQSPRAPPRMPYLVAYFLGPFQVFQGEEAIVAWDSLKSKAVFKYLLAHRGTPVQKDILMEVFWPEAAPEAAPRNLHQAIYSLRQTLRGKQPEFQHIRFENDCYFLNPRLEVWLDSEEFERHIQAARSLEAAGRLPEAIEHYTTAESLYQGDFLDEDLYEDWPKARRTHLQSTYLEIANRLTCHYLQGGMQAPAVALCRKVIAMDACNEEAHRQLICCYLAQGQRHLALRQYLMCSSALKEELNLSPSPETQALYQRIIA